MTTVLVNDICGYSIVMAMIPMIIIDDQYYSAMILSRLLVLPADWPWLTDTGLASVVLPKYYGQCETPYSDYSRWYSVISGGSILPVTWPTAYFSNTYSAGNTMFCAMSAMTKAVMTFVLNDVAIRRYLLA